MNNFLNKKIFFSFISLVVFIFPHVDISQAQATDNMTGMIPSCPYTFHADLKFNDRNEDVYVVQQILNSDARTMIAKTGPGSPGQETDYYGKATREAVKKFQALFIEFIGTADGKVNTNTRKVLQSICDGDFEKKKEKDPAPVETKVEEPGPQVTISTNVTIISPTSVFKVVVDLNKEVTGVDSGSFIVDGGTIREVRKLNKIRYVATIVPNEEAEKISVQIEAEKIKDKNGKVNEDASNEINVEISGSGVSDKPTDTGTSSSIMDTLSGLLNNITSTLPPTVNCFGVQIAATSTCTSPLLNGDQQQQQPPQDPSAMMQMLSQLMKGMGGGGGGQQGGGDKGGGDKGGGDKGGADKGGADKGGAGKTPGGDPKTPKGGAKPDDQAGEFGDEEMCKFLADKDGKKAGDLGDDKYSFWSAKSPKGVASMAAIPKSVGAVKSKGSYTDLGPEKAADATHCCKAEDTPGKCKKDASSLTKLKSPTLKLSDKTKIS